MDVRERLVNLGILLFLQTLADLRGLWDEVRSQSEAGQATPRRSTLIPARPIQDEARSRAA